MTRLSRARLCAAGALLAGALGCRPEPAVTVSAAMSLHEAAPALAARWKTDHPERPLRLNLDGSGTLARQLEAGAPVDVFLSADAETLNALGPLVAERRLLARNRLVVVVPAGSKLGGLDDLAGVRRLAVGSEVVPVGRYARRWLEESGRSQALEGRLVPADHARAVLAVVASGDVDAGLVYATDARVEPRVRVAFGIDDGPEVTYWAARIADAPHPEAAAELFAWLGSAAAREVLAEAGFVVPGPEPAP